MQLLNIGCGSTFEPSWTNIDIASSYPEVQSHDIRKGLPYPDAHFDACYSSHVLEHMTQEEANNLLEECWRVLKPQSIIRIVVPDLEQIVRKYLETLEQAEAGMLEAEPNYDWMMLEMYDQTVRDFGGGEMGLYLRNPEIKNKEFVRARIGLEAENFWHQEKGLKKTENFWEKIASKSMFKFANKLQYWTVEKIVTVLAGSETRRAFKAGIFRNSGEIHRWMYDRFSLRRMLEKNGFVEVRVCQATESRIANFNSYSLDVVNGKIRKPDSLFMEGIKP